MLQAAGHAGTLKKDTGSEGFILKPFDPHEAKNYEALWSNETDPLQKFVARWGSTTEMLVGSEETGEKKQFMRLGNLLGQFKKPCVMDCKMGLRTFQEKEAASNKPRADLYERLKVISPEFLSAEDHAAGAITKFKWMSSRDEASTSRKLGFRVDGIVSEQGARIDKKALDNFTAKEEVLQALPRVLPLLFSSEDVEDKEAINRHRRQQRITLIQQIIDQLTDIRTAMENSPFVKTHEFVGASLLFVVDPTLARVHLIDLAKTEDLPEDCTCDHRSPWAMGNHEDGLLLGVDSLLECWKTNLRWFEQGASGTEGRPCGSLGGKAMRDLELQLQTHKVDTSTWGRDGAKSLEELYSEINEEKAVTFEVAEDGRFFRVMDVIKAWIMVDLKGETLVLTQPKTHTKVAGNAAAETQQKDKRPKGKPLQKKISVGEDWRETVRMAISQRLGIDRDEQDEVFDFLWQTYKPNEETRLGTISDGFTGLWSKYRVHEIDIRVKDPNSPMLRPIGLPQGASFKTIQSEGSHSAFGYRQHSWTWQEISSAGYVARNHEAAEVDECGGQLPAVRLKSAGELIDHKISAPIVKPSWVLVLDCGSGSTRGSFYAVVDSDGSLIEEHWPHKMQPIHAVIQEGAASTQAFLDQLSDTMKIKGDKPASLILAATGGLRDALHSGKVTPTMVDEFNKALFSHKAFTGKAKFRILSGEDEALFEHKAVKYMAKQVMPTLAHPVGLISGGGTSSQMVYFPEGVAEAKMFSLFTNFKQQQLKILDVGVEEGLASLDKHLEELVAGEVPELIGQLKGVFCCIETMGQLGEVTKVGHRLVAKEEAVEAFTACLEEYKEKSKSVDPKAANWTYKETFRGAMPILALRLMSLLHPSAQLYFADVWKPAFGPTMQATVPLGLFLESVEH
jgi:1D-myo-inositol-triphosphate 3-kinase